MKRTIALAAVACILLCIVVVQHWRWHRAEREITLRREILAAVNDGNIPAAKMLLEDGAPVDAEYGYAGGQTLLERAVVGGYGESATTDLAMAQLLIDYGARLQDQDRGSAALARAIEDGRPKMVALLLENGADANMTTPRGLTPLTASLVYRQMEVFHMLLAKNADTDKTDGMGNVPLILSVSHGTNALAALLSAGADPDTEQGNGITVMHMVATRGCTNTVAMLTAAGADINKVDGRSNTPLMYAVRRGREDIARALLAAGADHAIASDGGKTPLQVAKDWKFRRIEAVLREYGAEE
jgi:ankyrin